MAAPAGPTPVFRFEGLEVDLRAGELRKDGETIKLQEQPLRILTMLLERPGEVVTREEIQRKLWPTDTFVEFDHSINAAIQRLRQALGDSAENPRFVETMARRGYRFIAPVEIVGAESDAPAVAPVSPPAISGVDRKIWKLFVPAARRAALLRRMALAAGIIVVALAVLMVLNIAGLRERMLRFVGAVREPPVHIQSLAVLPLENLSRDPEQEYFADGMTDELITSLAKIGSLRVISRNSVMQYKAQRKPTPQIAKELNVDAVVEGTVLRSGNRVRISAQLIQANPEKHLWAESYERDLGDVLALQSEVARAITKEIQIKATPQEQVRLARARPVKPEAYELYLKGRYHYYKWTPEDFRKAIEYFQQAIDADAGWAPAYAGLATSYGWLWMQGALPPQEALPRFEAALKTALTIDDTDPEVRYALAASAFYYRWDWEEAEREFQRALALDPNMVEARFEYAYFLSTMGRFPEALVEAQRAVERDPLSVSANFALANICFWARQDDRAIAQLRRTAELAPTDFRPCELLAYIYEQKQMYEEAIAERIKMMTLRGVPAEKMAMLERAYQQSGPGGYWMWRLSQAKRRNAPYPIAAIYAQMGNSGQAIAWLEISYQQRDPGMVQLKAIHVWDPIRSDPRFQDLLRRMNFPP